MHAKWKPMGEFLRHARPTHAADGTAQVVPLLMSVRVQPFLTGLRPSRDGKNNRPVIKTRMRVTINVKKNVKRKLPPTPAKRVKLKRRSLKYNRTFQKTHPRPPSLLEKTAQPQQILVTTLLTRSPLPFPAQQTQVKQSQNRTCQDKTIRC